MLGLLVAEGMDHKRQRKIIVRDPPANECRVTPDSLHNVRTRHLAQLISSHCTQFLSPRRFMLVTFSPLCSLCMPSLIHYTAARRNTKTGGRPFFTGPSRPLRICLSCGVRHHRGCGFVFAYVNLDVSDCEHPTGFGYEMDAIDHDDDNELARAFQTLIGPAAGVTVWRGLVSSFPILENLVRTLRNLT
jgi:hypothetical protein